MEKPLSEKEASEIPENMPVIVTQAGNVTEVQYMEKMNSKANIRKLDSERYLDLKTGEIKKFKRIENRSQSYNSLRQTFKKIRYLINHNFYGRENELFITLTYAENMTDTKRLYNDLKKFIKKVRYKFKDVTTIDFINIIEPQERGAWHSHSLLRFNELDTAYIHYDEIREMWGQGIIHVERLSGIDNVGAYLTAYLSDLPLTDENTHELLTNAENGKLEVKETEVDGEKKKFVKGGRLHMYPPGMNLYRKSKGILMPERKTMRYKDIKKIVGSAKPHYKTKKDIKKDNFENTIIYEQYNNKRFH